MAARLVPGWVRSYERPWLRPDFIAGVVIWSVVTPQAVAYAQIAGLPPEAGLMAAPPAMLAYAWFGTSRQLVVSATTATSAVSAAAIGPLAHGDPARFAALSAALALVTGVVLVAGGALRLGAISDFISKPVMTGFLFGLGMVITLAQLPSLLGVKPARGTSSRPSTTCSASWATSTGRRSRSASGRSPCCCSGGGSYPPFPRPCSCSCSRSPSRPQLDLSNHGVAVVGHIPDALPDPALPDVGAGDIVELVTPALGVLIMSAEAVGVARGLAVKHGYSVDPNRDLEALGASNLLAGLSSGFVQSGGASQTAAADGAGGRSQLATVVSAGLLLLTGAFLAPAVQGPAGGDARGDRHGRRVRFLDVAELRRFAHVRRSAIVFAGLGLAGVLALGVLQGLVVTAGLSLIYVIKRLSRPSVGTLARDPAPGPGDAATATRAGARPTARSWCAATACCSIPTPTRSRNAYWSWSRGRSAREPWSSTCRPRRTSTSRPPTCSTSCASSSRARTSSCASRRSARRGAACSTAPGSATGCRSPRRSTTRWPTTRTADAVWAALF